MKRKPESRERAPSGDVEGIMLFQPDLLMKVLNGTKTQTRRRHKFQLQVGRIYGVRTMRFEAAKGRIMITRCWMQRLGDVTLEEAKKEGFNTLDEFKERWAEIYGGWMPDLMVTAYEFKLVGSKS